MIVGFAFGTPAKIFANKVLWHRIEDLYNQHRMTGSVHIFTQPDLGDLMPLVTTMLLQVIDEEEGKPSPTLRICREAVAHAIRFRMTEIRIVAAQPHMWRCMRDMKMAMRENKLKIPVIAEKCEGMRWSSWFSKSSTQPHTRSSWVWLRREVILRFMPRWIYRYIAS